MTFIPSDEARDFMDFKKNHDPNLSSIIEKDDDWYYNDKMYVTNSHLKHLIDGGPQHLKAYYEKDKNEKEEAHFIFGRAQHCLLFEPELFNSRFYSIDDEDICIEASGKNWKEENKSPRATKIYKEWLVKILEENKNRQMLSPSDFMDITNMIDKLMGYSQIREMIEAAPKRETIYSNKIMGINCKSKLDACNPGNYILDYKSTKDPATLYKFKYVMNNYNYDRQAAFYRDVAKIPNFWFIVQEKTYPYTVCIAELSPDSYEIGKKKYEFGLEMYNKHFIKNPKEIDSYFESGTI